jgi:TIR domain
MSFLAPHFDPDVFVSYSHGDPKGRSTQLRDWTQALIDRLQGQVLDLETEFKDLRLWIDRQIDPTLGLTPQLKKLVSNSGVLMIVLSKHYLESSWCREEREWFQKEIEGRLGESGRVFVLRAQETDIALWPEFIRELTGFSFYDPQNGLPWDFPDLKEPNAEFGKELLRLHLWLTKRLREQGKKAREKSAPAAVALKPPGPRLIYIRAPPEGDAARAEIGQALKSDGFLPVVPAPSGNNLAGWQREANIRLEAAKSCEALTLLRVPGAEKFVGDLLDIGVSERERIVMARGAPLPCAVFDKTGADLPIDIAGYGIERFDVTQAEWHGQFRSWLDASYVQLGAVAL